MGTKRIVIACVGVEGVKTSYCTGIAPNPRTQKERKITQDPPLALLEEHARIVTCGSSGSGALAPGKLIAG
jgi:hypothetical protein